MEHGGCQRHSAGRSVDCNLWIAAQARFDYQGTSVGLVRLGEAQIVFHFQPLASSLPFYVRRSHLASSGRLEPFDLAKSAVKFFTHDAWQNVLVCIVIVIKSFKESVMEPQMQPINGRRIFLAIRCSTLAGLLN